MEMYRRFRREIKRERRKDFGVADSSESDTGIIRKVAVSSSIMNGDRSLTLRCWRRRYSSRILISFTMICFYFVYTMFTDYAWQIILLKDVVSSPRKACSIGGAYFTDLPFHAYVSMGPGTDYEKFTGDATDSHLVKDRSKRLKFGILMVFDALLMKEEMTILSVQNKKQYAALHGYEVILATDPVSYSQVYSKKHISTKGRYKYQRLLPNDFTRWANGKENREIENKEHSGGKKEAEKNKEKRLKKKSLFQGSGDIDSSRPPAWSKIRALHRHLHRFDYLFYVDVDALIVNFDVTLEDLVNMGSISLHEQQKQQFADKDRLDANIIISEDWNGVNTGIFLVRNSSWSLWFLAEAWGAEDSEQEWMSHHSYSRRSAGGHISSEYVTDPSSLEKQASFISFSRDLLARVVVMSSMLFGPRTRPKRYPFEYEQRSFHYLLQTRKWCERGLPHYDYNARYAEIFGGSDDQKSLERSPWDHVALLPQCALNSYMMYPPVLSLAWKAFNPFTEIQRIDSSGSRSMYFTSPSSDNEKVSGPSCGKKLMRSEMIREEDKWASAQWVAGDFVIHMAGHKGNNKRELFKHSYMISKQSEMVSTEMSNKK